MKALKAILVAILLAASSFSAVALDVPRLQGRVNDYAAVLTPSQRQELERTLSAIEQETTAQVVVLTVKSLEGQDIALFTKDVFASWRLGQADKNNGVLMVVSQDDRKIRIVPGRGLEGVLPDGECWSIIRKIMAPELKRGSENYFVAIKGGVERIRSLIYEESAPGSKPISSTNTVNEGTLIVFAVVMLLAGFAGMMHMVVGGIVGGAGWGIAAWVIFGSTAGFFGLVFGFIIGLFACFILDILMQVGFGGGSGGGFGGGGGIELGGGASGDF